MTDQRFSKVMAWQREAEALPANLRLPEGVFKPWEEWAWREIAQGRKADMARVPLAFRGGDDDRRPVLEAMRQAAGGEAPVDAEALAADLGDEAAQGETDPASYERDPESQVLRRHGEDAPEGFTQGDLIPRADGGPHFRSWQTLSAAFLETILFDEPYAAGRIKPYVRIQHACIRDELDFENGEFHGELGMYASLFMKAVNWRGLSVGRLINLHRSTFRGAFMADGLKTSGGVFIRGGANFEGELILRGAAIGSNLECDGSTFCGAFSTDGLKIGGSIFLDGGATFEGDVRLLGANIGVQLNCIGSTFRGEFMADGLKIIGGVFLNGGANFEGDVRLLGADIGESLACIGSNFRGAFMADGLKTGGHVYLRGGANLEGDVTLPGAAIGGDLQLGGGNFAALVDLEKARVGGALVLGAERYGEDPSWGDKASLNLALCRAEALISRLSAWKRGGAWVPCNLEGFTFERLGAGHSDRGGMQTEGSAKLAEWVRASQKDDGFSPAPYLSLAETLRKAGFAQKARDILFRMQSAENRARSWFNPLNWPVKPYQLFMNWTTGHGYHPWRAAWWSLGFVLAGAALGFALMRGAGREAGYGAWVLAALEAYTPLIDLAPSALRQSPPLDQLLGLEMTEDGMATGWTAAARWVHHAFTALNILGYLLLTMLVAALTGRARQRSE